MKRILSCFLLCATLVGCHHHKSNLQAHHLDEKRQGFDKKEVESFIREPEKVNDAVNPQFKNKDIISLFLMGLTKEEMKYLDSKDLRFFNNKSPSNKWNDMNEQAVEEIFKKHADHQIIRCNPYKQMLCTASTIYTIHEKKVMELNISVSLLNPEEHGYAVVLSYKWLTDPKEKKADFYGVLTTENAIVDYDKFYSSYKTYRDESHMSTKHYNKPYQSSIVGYVIKNSLNKENSRHFGYLYSEVVPSDLKHKYIDVEGFYVHVKKRGVTDSFSFQDVFGTNVNDDVTTFKSSIIRITIKK